METERQMELSRIETMRSQRIKDHNYSRMVVDNTIFTEDISSFDQSQNLGNLTIPRNQVTPDRASFDMSQIEFKRPAPDVN
jgi:hypothetical protein